MTLKCNQLYKNDFLRLYLNRAHQAYPFHLADGIPTKLRYNVSFVVGGFHNSMIQWITTGFHETAAEMAAIVSDMFKDSISYWPMLDE